MSIIGYGEKDENGGRMDKRPNPLELVFVILFLLSISYVLLRVFAIIFNQPISN